jgi:hypothetical protein
VYWPQTSLLGNCGIQFETIIISISISSHECFTLDLNDVQHMVHHSCQIPTNDVQLHELNKSSTQNNTHYQMANELMTLTGPNNKHNKQNNITSNASLV